MMRRKRRRSVFESAPRRKRGFFALFIVFLLVLRMNNSVHLHDDVIFVSMPSRRDVDCGATVAHLFAQARDPRRVYVRVVEQRFTRVEKFTCLEDAMRLAKGKGWDLESRVVVDRVEASLAKGVIASRFLAALGSNNAEFCMSVDSHTRFAKHWDDSVLDQFKTLGNERAVLTTYPPRIERASASVQLTYPMRCSTSFLPNGIARGPAAHTFLRSVSSLVWRASKPKLTPFWAAGFSFS